MADPFLANLLSRATTQTLSVKCFGLFFDSCAKKNWATVELYSGCPVYTSNSVVSTTSHVG